MENSRGFEIPDPMEKSQNSSGTTYILSIGIDAYTHCRTLNNAQRDAQAFEEVMKEVYGFDERNIYRVYEADATRKGIWKAFQEMQKRLTSEDNLVIYYAGHGYLNKSLDWGYWVPVDAIPQEEDTYIRNQDIMDFIKTMNCYHLVLISDSCFSGSFFRARDPFETFSKDPSRWAITSGRKQKVMDGDPGLGSPFSKYLIKYLRQNPGAMLLSELGHKVKISTNAHTELYQTPQAEPLQIKGHEGGEYVFRRAGMDIPDEQEPDKTPVASGLSRSHNDSSHSESGTSQAPHKLHHVYFSYARGEQENIVDGLYTALLADDPSYQLLRDTMDIEYGGLISEFMQAMGKGELIVVFLSDAYIRSPYCMYELYEIARNCKFEKDLFSQKVLPVPLEQLKLDDPIFLEEYFTYWEDEKKTWQDFVQKRMERGNPSRAQSDRLFRVQEVERHLGDLADWLQDMNAARVKLLSDNDFAPIKEAIARRLGK